MDLPQHAQNLVKNCSGPVSVINLFFSSSHASFISWILCVIRKPEHPPVFTPRLRSRRTLVGLCSFSLDFIYMYIYIYIVFIYISWQKAVWKFMWQSRMCAVLFCVHSGSTRVLYIILNISNSEFYRVSIPLKERISSGLYNYNSTRPWQWKHVIVKKKEDKPLMLSNNLYFQIIRSVFSSMCMVSWFSLCLWCWIIAFFVDQSKDLFQVWYMRTIINSAVWSLCFSP